jgi:ABC-type antimicrobial peptide transport system permease subunit
VIHAIGLYGVISFGVTQRTREIGVRIALGARYGDVMQLIMSRGMLLLAADLAIGTAGSVALGRVLAGLLYGVAPGARLTLAATTLILVVVATIANYLPARRAARVNPIVALRVE